MLLYADDEHALFVALQSTKMALGVVAGTAWRLGCGRTMQDVGLVYAGVQRCVVHVCNRRFALSKPQCRTQRILLAPDISLAKRSINLLSAACRACVCSTSLLSDCTRIMSDELHPKPPTMRGVPARKVPRAHASNSTASCLLVHLIEASLVHQQRFGPVMRASQARCHGASAPHPRAPQAGGSQ